MTGRKILHSYTIYQIKITTTTKTLVIHANNNNIITGTAKKFTIVLKMSKKNTNTLLNTKKK